MEDTTNTTTVDTQVEDFSKSVLSSRTLWVSVVAPLAITLFPPLAPILAANPTTSAWVAGGVMALFRLISSKPLHFPWSK